MRILIVIVTILIFTSVAFASSVTLDEHSVSLNKHGIGFVNVRNDSDTDFTITVEPTCSQLQVYPQKFELKAGQSKRVKFKLTGKDVQNCRVYFRYLELAGKNVIDNPDPNAVGVKVKLEFRVGIPVKWQN